MSEAEPPAPALPPAVHPPAIHRERIDSTFRNGSVTAIGVVVGFTLGFLSNWASAGGTWTAADIAAVIVIGVGNGCQIRALAGMLAVDSLQIPVYERLVRWFLVGVIMAVIGVALAIGGDVVGLSHYLAPA